MNKLMNFGKKHPAVFGGVLFGLLSVILNCVWIFTFDTAHIHDVVHILPTILTFDPILELTKGATPSEFMFVPLGVVIDFVVGMLVGLITGKICKSGKAFLLSLALGFCIYWIAITYQWIPIFG